MAVRSESWSRPAEPGRQALLLALALSLFLGVWAALHAGFYTRSQIVDTPVYQRYGDAIVHGQVPYRDFGVEYPPGALPVFVVPALGHSERSDFERYRQIFEAVARIREQGTTTVLVEQNSRALSIADHGYVLSHGRLDLEGPAQELFGDERLRRAYLGG